MVGFAGCGLNTSSNGSVVGNASDSPANSTDEGSDETAQTQTQSTTTNIGGSLNGRPRRLRDDFALVEKSNTQWMHAFFDVLDKHERDVTPQSDPDVRALRRLGKESGVNLTISLQWDFMSLFGDKKKKTVPRSGSARENALFEYATELLTAIDYPVEKILLANEPVWETPDRAIQGLNSRFITFTRGLKTHLVQQYSLGDPRLMVGSFNRLYDDHVRTEYGRFYDQLFDMARNDDDIDGVDLHIHYDQLQEAETMLSVARKKVPDATVTATEFSPMWRYHRNKDTPISEYDGGARFAEQYGFSKDTTGQEYFEAAKNDPRPPEEMGAFMEMVPWYNVRCVEDMYNLLHEYDIELGSFGFFQGPGIRHAEWGEDWRPFQINYLFQRGLIASPDGAHPHYLDDYRRRT